MTRATIPFHKRAGVATGYRSLIDELETAFANRDVGARVEILRRVTDLFVSGAEGFHGEQSELFDDVMCRLVGEIDRSALAAFGERIAAVANAPPLVSRALALDDSIEVAGPLLALSQSLDDTTLVTGAKTKGQQHLLAISRRKVLSEDVTDVLVERGNHDVVVATAANHGARFSEFGYSTLVSRSQNDDELALTVWSRPEIPREHLLALCAVVSEAVRHQLEAGDRKKATLIQGLVKQASDHIQAKIRERSSGFATAEAQVRSLNQAGGLNEHRLCEFAEAGKFDETAVTLSLMCAMPVGVIERVLVDDCADQIVMLAKSAGFSWNTTRAVLLLQASIKGTPLETIDQCLANFNKLKPETARTAIQFYKLRERAAK
jgi:uncharacterized protein (DUF2336 family)